MDNNILLSSVFKDGVVSKDKSGIVFTISQNLKVTITDDLYVFDTKITCIVEKNASLIYTFRGLKKSSIKEIKKDLVFVCAGQGASVVVECLAESSLDQKFIFKTLQHHEASDTTSRLVIKGVVHGRAVFKSENIIRIDKGIRGVVACEENRNLLLSDHARVITIPKLEIQSNDISCHHGAAVSKISDDDLFYFQSRGMDQKCAQRVLIKAFLVPDV